MVPFRVQRLMRRLNSPQDTNMAIAVACALLFAEAVLSALIIWRIPCASLLRKLQRGAVQLDTLTRLKVLLLGVTLVRVCNTFDDFII